MNRASYWLLVASAFLLLFVNGTVLDLIGWSYSLDSGSTITKFHPGTYLLVVTLVVATYQTPFRVLRAVRDPAMILFLVATFVLFVRAIFIVRAGDTGGEFSAVITNFLTTALFLIIAGSLDATTFSRFVILVRTFFVLNSLMALAERAIGHRFVPSFLDSTSDTRAAALVAHPLIGSLLTGLMLIWLVSARRQRLPIWTRLPEIGLHAAAMFAFGGRSALVATPTVLLLSAIMGRPKRGEASISSLQRVLPFAVLLLGIILIFAPIPFVDATLDRFSEDGNSASTRDSAIQMITTIPTSDLLFGMRSIDRTLLANFYKTPAGFELAWISLTATYGLLAVIPMAIALPVLLFRTARKLDRSAFYMAIQFLIVTAGSLSFGVKSLVIAQVFIMMSFLSQPTWMELSARGRRQPGLFGGMLDDTLTDEFASIEGRRPNRDGRDRNG
jgi:hypothetical protein